MKPLIVLLLLATTDASISPQSVQLVLATRGKLEAADPAGNNTSPVVGDQIPAWQFWRQSSPTDANETAKALPVSSTPSQSNASEVPRNMQTGTRNNSTSENTTSLIESRDTRDISFASRWVPRWVSKEVTPIEPIAPPIEVEDTPQTPISTRLDARIRAWVKGKQTNPQLEPPPTLKAEISSNATEKRRAVLWLLNASSRSSTLAADSLERLRLNRAALARNAALIAANATHLVKAALLYKFPVSIFLCVGGRQLRSHLEVCLHDSIVTSV